MAIFLCVSPTLSVLVGGSLRLTSVHSRGRLGLEMC